MAPRIHLLRHAQGHHQLEPTSQNSQLHDPYLTPYGLSQCKSFAATFPVERYPIELVCASPLRRTIQTATHCFPSIPKPILLLPYAQEASSLPSDTGSDREMLKGEFGDVIDASLVEDGWNSNQGVYAPGVKNLKDRSRRLTAWLEARTEAEVVVVGHGMFWHYVTGEVDEDGKQTTPYWQNTEWRTYTFAHDPDGEARLVEEEESVMRRELPN